MEERQNKFTWKKNNYRGGRGTNTGEGSDNERGPNWLKDYHITTSLRLEGAISAKIPKKKRGGREKGAETRDRVFGWENCEGGAMMRSKARGGAMCRKA